MSEFRMPSLGSDMEAGTLVEWLVEPGQTVKRGDIVAVVETQKGAIEIEIFEDGAISALLIEPGQKVPVGTAMAVINGGAPTGKPTRPEEPEKAAGPEVTSAALPAAKPPPLVAPVVGAAPAGVRASPAARKLAQAQGVDLAGLTGTGPGGAITAADVLNATPTPKAAPPEAKGEPSMRDAIAAAMTRANREIPHYYLSGAIDMRASLDWLEAANRERPVTDRLLYAVLLIKAVALGLRAVPELNGTYVDGTFRRSDAVNLGFAVALRGGGLIAPALFDADKKDLDTIMTELRDLVARSRSGGLRSSEMSAQTTTLTSLGERGVDTVFPVIYPPQVAIIGFGSIGERPWSVAGKVVSRPVVTVSVAGDHRVSDGHRGALFVRKVDELLQEPDRL